MYRQQVLLVRARHCRAQSRVPRLLKVSKPMRDNSRVSFPVTRTDPRSPHEFPSPLAP